MKRYLFLIVVSVLIINLPALAGEEVITARELVENSRIFDKARIIYEGEAIGELMPRGNYFWINVLDSDTAIGVWAPARFRPLIRYTGSYKNSGDLIRIEGVFNENCPRHSGELDIHADEITVIKKGNKTSHPISSRRKRAALILFLGAVCIMTLTLLNQKRYKK